MPETQPDQSIHLPSLVIKNFRGIDDLTIPRLGRGTLLAGKNGVGKTTVLDAVRVWADRGLTGVLDEVLVDRGDSFATTENGQHKAVPDRAALFTNRGNSAESLISIAPIGDPEAMLKVNQIPVPVPYAPNPHLPDDKNHIELERQFGNYDPADLVRLKLSSSSLPEMVMCNITGPNVPSDEIIEQYWHDVALSAHEDRAVEALNLITNVHVERVAAVRLAATNSHSYQRRLMVKLEGKDYPVPLRTLGDGAMRMFAVALSLAKSSGGFLLIDEAENGIHHTIQAKFWKMVLQTAQRNNVQVIATTHSWDCVKGFAEASAELEDAEGVLVRLERHEGRLRAVEYSERNLKAAANYGIEAR